MFAATDTTAIFVALIGAIATIVTAALALLGVWLTSRNQIAGAAKDARIADLEKRLGDLEREK